MDNRRYRRNRRKKSKTYYVGMMVLFIFCAMYMIMYPQFGEVSHKPDTNTPSQTEEYEPAENSAQVLTSSDDSEAQSATQAAIAAIEEKEQEVQEDEAEQEQEELLEQEEQEVKESESDQDKQEAQASQKTYRFRYQDRLTGHYEKHGIDMGFSSEAEYLAGANALINNPEALHKTEAEDGDDIYYLEATNEIAFVSTDGYIRTYFICSGKDYYDRQ
ncbi:hypothetical protein [Butyrivibrio sp. VCD2006]|uniref:hypothetical protein n=1 Tax=Butyrivibrio sp. VCD2006 TaxID=1280664 RepID=UPI000687351B|nr:hypothetical protein [Butyrivibrio sp. VCD2006]